MNRETVLRQGTQWYAVRVPHRFLRPRGKTYRNTQPFLIETILRKRDFEIFVPSKKVWRRTPRKTKEKHLVKVAALSGWVFVGWPTSEDRWSALLEHGCVTRVAGIGGQPYAIPQDVMTRLFQRWGGVAIGDTTHTLSHLNIGDHAKIMHGPLEGADVEICDLKGPKARVLLDCLGSKHLLEIKTHELDG